MPGRQMHPSRPSACHRAAGSTCAAPRATCWRRTGGSGGLTSTTCRTTLMVRPGTAWGRDARGWAVLALPGVPQHHNGWEARGGAALYLCVPGRCEVLCPCPGATVDPMAPDTRAPCTVWPWMCQGPPWARHVPTRAGTWLAGPRGQDPGSLPARCRQPCLRGDSGGRRVRGATSCARSRT